MQMMYCALLFLTYFYDKSEIVVIRTRNYNISVFDFILDIRREERLVNNTTLILDHHQEETDHI